MPILFLPKQPLLFKMEYFLKEQRAFFQRLTEGFLKQATTTVERCMKKGFYKQAWKW